MQTKTIEESKKSYFVSYAEGINTSKGGDETALIVEDPRINEKGIGYFILNGDWVDEYKKCNSKSAQIKLFRKKLDLHGGFWTNTLKELNNLMK